MNKRSSTTQICRSRAAGHLQFVCFNLGPSCVPCVLHRAPLSPWRRRSRPLARQRRIARPRSLSRYVVQTDQTRCNLSEKNRKGLMSPLSAPQELLTVTWCQWVSGSSVGSSPFWSWRNLCVCWREVTDIRTLTHMVGYAYSPGSTDVFRHVIIVWFQLYK